MPPRRSYPAQMREKDVEADRLRFEMQGTARPRPTSWSRPSLCSRAASSTTWSRPASGRSWSSRRGGRAPLPSRCRQRRSGSGAIDEAAPMLRPDLEETEETASVGGPCRGHLAKELEGCGRQSALPGRTLAGPQARICRPWRSRPPRRNAGWRTAGGLERGSRRQEQAQQSRSAVERRWRTAGTGSGPTNVIRRLPAAPVRAAAAPETRPREQLRRRDQPAGLRHSKARLYRDGADA